MAEEKKVTATESAGTEGKASISEKLKAAEGNINRAAEDAKARKSEQAKTQKKSESEAKARLEEAEKARLESERAARLVAEQKLAAFEYAENYRKKLMRDKQRTASAAKQKAKEERAAAEAEEKRAREAEIAAMIEKERNEARERGNRAADLLSRVTKLAVVDGEGNLRIVDKNEAAKVERAEAPAPAKAEAAKPITKPADTYTDKVDGKIFVTEDSFGTYPTRSYFEDDMVVEEDGKLLLNISDNRMFISVSDGNPADEAREYQRYAAAQRAAAEAYSKEAKRVMDAFEALINPTAAADKVDEAADTVAVECDAVAEAPVEEAKTEVATAPVVAAVVAEPVEEVLEVAEPAIEEPAIEEPTAEEPAIEEPTAEEPVIEEIAPVVEEPAVVEEPVEAPVEEVKTEVAAAPVVAAVVAEPEVEKILTAEAKAESVAEPAPEKVEEKPEVKSEETPAEPAPVEEKTVEEKAEKPLPEKKEKTKKEKAEKPAKAPAPAEEEEVEDESVTAAAVVSVDEGIVAELRAIAARVTGIKSLKRYLAKLNKAVKKISREVARLDKKLEVPDVNEAPATAVEKLVILADLLEIKSDALTAAVRIVAKKFVKRLKAELTELIEEYNRTASSYAAMTGEQLTRVSAFLPKYIAEGTGTAIIPKLTYSEKYVEVNEEEKAANASYVFVFPNINDIAEGGTLTATPDVTSEGGEDENSLAKRVVITSPYTNEELLDVGTVYNARELHRAVKKIKKSYKKLDRELVLIHKKREAAIAESDERESLKMLVEEITVKRQKVEITAALLGYCRDVKVKKFISAVKADMIEAMAEYNKSVDAYFGVTGETLTRAAAYEADEVLEGKPAPRLAKLAYYRELVETVGDTVKVIGRKDKKKTLPTTSCTFIFGTTPIVTAGPAVAAAPAMPALQAQLVPPAANDADAKPSFVISAAPAAAPAAVAIPAAKPAPAPAATPAPIPMPTAEEPTTIVALSDIIAPEPIALPEEEPTPEVVVAEPAVDEFDEGELAAMDLREAKKRIARMEREIATHAKKLDSRDKAKNKSAGIDRATLIIECLEEMRCIIGTRCEILELYVHVGEEKGISLTRSSLLLDISKYNEYVSEYNLNASESLPSASTAMVDCILNGQSYKKLPKIVYKGTKTTAAVKAAAADNNELAEYIKANATELEAKHLEDKALKKKVKRAKGDGQKAALLVQRINVRVFTVNMLIEQLEKCAAAKNVKYRKETVKALNLEIKAYNSLAEEYTALTNRAVVLADVKLARAIVNRKPYAKLASVSEVGFAADKLKDNVASQSVSFADSVRISVERTETESKCEDQKKKAVEVLNDEYDFFIDKLYTKRKDMSLNFKGLNGADRSRIAKITKKIAELERRKANVAKQEALDNARYYEAVLTDVSSLGLKSESDRAALREVQHKIAELLNERDAKNVELIKHYAGTEEAALKEQKRAHREVRFKAESKEFDSLRKVDKNLRARYENGELDSYKPEKIHAAMREMIEAKGEMAVCKARLKESGKVKLTKHQCEMVKKEQKGWEKKYKEAESRLKNNLKRDPFKRMLPLGIAALVILAIVIGVVLAWPMISPFLAGLGIGI